MLLRISDNNSWGWGVRGARFPLTSVAGENENAVCGRDKTDKPRLNYISTEGSRQFHFPLLLQRLQFMWLMQDALLPAASPPLPPSGRCWPIEGEYGSTRQHYQGLKKN